MTFNYHVGFWAGFCQQVVCASRACRICYKFEVCACGGVVRLGVGLQCIGFDLQCERDARLQRVRYELTSTKKPNHVTLCCTTPPKVEQINVWSVLLVASMCAIAKQTDHLQMGLRGQILNKYWGVVNLVAGALRDKKQYVSDKNPKGCRWTCGAIAAQISVPELIQLCTWQGHRGINHP